MNLKIAYFFVFKFPVGSLSNNCDVLWLPYYFDAQSLCVGINGKPKRVTDCGAREI